MKLVNSSFFALGTIAKGRNEKNEPPACLTNQPRILEATNLPKRSLAVVQTHVKNKAHKNKAVRQRLFARATGTDAKMKGAKNFVRTMKEEFSILKSRRAHITANPAFLKNDLSKIFMARHHDEPTHSRQHISEKLLIIYSTLNRTAGCICITSSMLARSNVTRLA